MFTAWVVELVDTQDLKSCGPKRPYGFDPRPGYESRKRNRNRKRAVHISLCFCSCFCFSTYFRSCFADTLTSGTERETETEREKKLVAPYLLQFLIIPHFFWPKNIIFETIFSLNFSFNTFPKPFSPCSHFKEPKFI